LPDEAYGAIMELAPGRDLAPPKVVAATLPFFARAAAVVGETWHELDQMAASWISTPGSALPERNASSELMASGVRGSRAGSSGPRDARRVLASS
jgi:hypothetical protein